MKERLAVPDELRLDVGWLWGGWGGSGGGASSETPRFRIEKATAISFSRIISKFVMQKNRDAFFKVVACTGWCFQDRVSLQRVVLSS